MRPLAILGASRRKRLNILCLGAHCDDVDIGCGGALLALLDRYSVTDVTWVIFSAHGERENELRRSARHFLRRATASRIVTHNYRDGFMPAHFTAIKENFEALKSLPQPDLIFTHQREDRHQDHRLIAEIRHTAWVIAKRADDGWRVSDLQF